GTLFLDEIADTAPDVQAMLLRVLENGEYQAVGGTTTERADVRVIAATDAKLDAAVKEGRFRLPLFHRLATHQIMVPPLRERREDVGVLLMHFLSRELQTIGQGDLLDPRSPKEASWLPAELVERMLLSTWPGNVRQLYNVARNLVASNRERSSVHPDSVPEHILGEVAKGSSSAASAGSSSKPAPADIGDEGLIRALRANDWKMAATAKSLGIARSSLYRLIDASSAIRKAKDVSREEIEAAHARHGGAAEAMAVALEVSPRGLKLRMKDLGISD
ncbi:MAG: sigma 54-interacting transcriptional regulator, partial [Polyangiaceae bacterium]